MGRTIIHLANVTKRFGAVPAVADVSLDLEEGEFFCLLGPSGCGKSTLLRLLAGFEDVDGGTMELDGADLAPIPPHRRPLNTMFQSYALFPHMSIAANVAYGLKRAGLSRAERDARLAEMIRLGRLGGLEARSPAQLSGGQRQRVALVRALARRPRVLLLDEPLGALDRSLREETRAELKDLQARLGTTFVMVTHDQEEAMGLADRTGIMRAGRLVQVGTPRAIYEEPADRFVAGFLGAANLLEGVVEGRAGGFARLRLPDGTVLEGVDASGGAGEGALMVRPERVVLAPPRSRNPDLRHADERPPAASRSTHDGGAFFEAPAVRVPQDDAPGSLGPDFQHDAVRDFAGRNQLVATVLVASYLGDQVSLRLGLPGGGELRVAVPASRAAAVPARGEVVTVAFAAEDARVLA